MPAYCVKCRKKTPDVSPVQATKNGRLMIKSACDTCGSKKSEFISSGSNACINSCLNADKKGKKGKRFWSVPWFSIRIHLLN